MSIGIIVAMPLLQAAVSPGPPVGLAYSIVGDRDVKISWTNVADNNTVLKLWNEVETWDATGWARATEGTEVLNSSILNGYNFTGACGTTYHFATWCFSIGNSNFSTVNQTIAIRMRDCTGTSGGITIPLTVVDETEEADVTTDTENFFEGTGDIIDDVPNSYVVAGIGIIVFLGIAWKLGWLAIIGI